MGAAMRFDAFSFGSIRIDGVTYQHDVVIDRGQVRKRKKKPSKAFREAFGHYTAIDGRGHSLELPTPRDRHGHRSVAGDG
jgi:hypothetical protein